MKIAYWTSLALLAVASIEVQAQDRQPQYEDSQAYQQYQAPRRPQQIGQRARPVQYRKVAPPQQDDFAQFEGSPYLKSNSQMQMKVKPRASMLHLEPVFGMNQSTFEGVQGTNGTKIENLNGYQAGMNVLMGSSNTQFESGLHYAQRGAKITNMSAQSGGYWATGYDLSYNFKYLEIPAMARYNFTPPSRSGFFVKGGAVLGLLMEATGKVDKQPANAFVTNSESNIKNKYNDTDLRLALGAGGTLRFSNTMAATIGLDYQRSLSKINKEDIKTITGDSLEFLNSSMQLSAGLIFDL